MARQNVYMNQKTYDALKSIVEERRADGASFSDANMSSVSSEMLEIGIRVTMNLKKKSEELGEDGYTWEDLYKKQIMDDLVKSKICLQKIFEMLFDLQEIKSDSRYDFREAVQKMKSERDELLAKFFDDKEQVK
ncbi:TPA: relaxosome protein TraM [Morganella morganii]